MTGRVAYLGVAFVLFGAALLAAPTFGFETIAADRTAEVDTAGDANALVGFEETAESIEGRQDTAVAFRLQNNADRTLQLSVDNAVANDGDVQISSDGSGTIAPGESTDVVLECNGGGGSGTTTVTTTVVQATGSTLTIADAESSTSLDYQCTGGGPGGGGPANFAASDPQYDGDDWAQQFEVDVSALGPHDDLTIDLGDAQATSGVDYSDATATMQSGQNARTFDFDPQTSTVTFEVQGNPSGTLSVELSGLQPTSDQDGTASFSDSTGRTGTDTFAVPAIGNDDGGTETDGDVVVENGTNANGEIEAGGDVLVGDGSQANGEIEAGGDVTAGDGVNLNGPVEADGTVAIGDGSSVNHDIEAGGDVYFQDGSTANAAVDAEGTVYVGCDVTYDESRVEADGGIVSTCSE